MFNVLIISLDLNNFRFPLFCIFFSFFPFSVPFKYAVFPFQKGMMGKNNDQTRNNLHVNRVKRLFASNGNDDLIETRNVAFQRANDPRSIELRIFESADLKHRIDSPLTLRYS